MLGLAAMTPAAAAPFFFSTGNPDGKMAAASRPDSAGKFEIETADDFVLTGTTTLSSATFTGLMPLRSSVQSVTIEIYRVFPKDSNTVRTPLVPTRVNSPSDVVFGSRDSTGGTLSFTTTTLSASFTANNSVLPGGIHPSPNQTTGGNGAVTGQEVEFDIAFNTTISLVADHYFFVPMVQLDNGDFLWLSAPKPIVAPGTSLLPDLQSWTRDAALDPDWLRIGADIVGGAPAPQFNAAFSLNGEVTDIPEPASPLLFVTAFAGLFFMRRSGRSQRA